MVRKLVVAVVVVVADQRGMTAGAMPTLGSCDDILAAVKANVPYSSMACVQASQAAAAAEQLMEGSTQTHQASISSEALQCKSSCVDEYFEVLTAALENQCTNGTEYNITAGEVDEEAVIHERFRPLAARKALCQAEMRGCGPEAVATAAKVLSFGDLRGQEHLMRQTCNMTRDLTWDTSMGCCIHGVAELATPSSVLGQDNTERTLASAVKAKALQLARLRSWQCPGVAVDDLDSCSSWTTEWKPVANNSDYFSNESAVALSSARSAHVTGSLGLLASAAMLAATARS